MSSRCFLLIGPDRDPWCGALSELIGTAGDSVITTPAVFGDLRRFRWKFNNTQSSYELEIAPDETIHDRDLSGVFVAFPPWLSAQGWIERDFGYAQAEASATILGWLWSLPCKVLNRYPASIWYRQPSNLLAWSRPLREAGLRMQPGNITNDPEEARSFAGPVAVYNLLGSAASFLVVSEAEWSSLASLMLHTHVYVTRPHGPVFCACVLGNGVVWAKKPPGAEGQETKLIRFARRCGSAFIEVVFVEGEKGLDVIAVNPFPEWRDFSAQQTQAITSMLYALLRGPEGIASGGERVA